MRKKNRKLMLNRETVRHLSSGLDRVAGGITQFGILCQSEVTTCGTAEPNCETATCGGGGTYFTDCTGCTNTCGTGGACPTGVC